MRKAVIEDHVVVNLIEAGDGFTLAGRTLVAAPDEVRKGWLWDGSSFSPPVPSKEEARDQQIAAIEERYNTILNGGFDYDFGSKTATLEDGSTETAGVRTLQTRPIDRERWATTNQVAVQYITGGNPGEPMRPFRTSDNARVPMTAQEANDCLNAMQARFGAALEQMWNHKDAVRQMYSDGTKTASNLLAYDITTGWPS